jgi:hypothetical protein
MKGKRSHLMGGAIAIAIALSLSAPVLNATDTTYYPLGTPDLSPKVSTKGERIDSTNTYYPVGTPDISSKVSTKGEKIEKISTYSPIGSPKF